jgi:hypothetical protein
MNHRFSTAWKWKRLILLVAVLAALTLVPVPARSPVVQAVPEIFASPIHAGCYQVRYDRCKIHVEPFTINIASGTKLVNFKLVALRTATGQLTPIYDFRPDQSNPVPGSGTTFSPSLVAKDFAAVCGISYEISLQGQDTGDANPFNLGLTTAFTCPVGTYRNLVPRVGR